MGKLIPSRNACLPRMTPGERRFAQRLEDKLDEAHLCWYDVPIGPRQRHPDFIVLHPNSGFLILEVKDWKLDTIAAIDRSSVTLHTERGRSVVENPLVQARSCALEVKALLERDQALRHPEDHRYAGKLVSPWGWGVVLSNITRRQFEEAGLEDVMPAHLVLCKDEIAESADPDAFHKALADMFMMPFACALTPPQIDRFRWALFPELRVPEQGKMFESRAESEPDLARVPDLIRVMDLQQEQLARSMGDGHRVIHGVAGSGKTMILGYRCIELAKRYAKPILVLCFNKTLAARLEQMVRGSGIDDKIFVAHFHGWCSQQLSAYAIKRPSSNLSIAQYADALVESVIRSVDGNAIPRAQYAAVLIDEGHDFKPEWLKLVVQMVDPDTNSLLLLYDDAQNIYEGQARRKFSFASVGIQAPGRTTILRLNYRNTLEILATAKAFAQEVVSEQESDDDHVPLIAPESAGRRGPMPELVQCPDPWAEAALIAEHIRTAVAQGASANDFGIVCRTTHIAERVASKLSQAGVSHALAGADKRRHLFDGPPSAKIMTLHSSKGLEFDTIFIPSLCATPHSQDAEALNREARLLYVGMTRALGRLVILHHRPAPMVERVRNAIANVRQVLEAA
ncbi:DEAD/DEAH box helicase [Lysobacter enzymogenes]|uniref:DEAD/DEAH box helicase n=1 Tax=Lysobacter enzymogenes TaxID=69 RepID=UPI00089A6DC8|nr:3'-5' exonuclease [Lysobacter enzymogenes]SDX20509.1 UvrD-like helicase C-terminal domain-containing protein [Lysobacter enzymogenes]